ncbi:Hsp70 family protein [bacterium]|nr:Hsp70 family protein [bacterium]
MSHPDEVSESDDELEFDIPASALPHAPTPPSPTLPLRGRENAGGTPKPPVIPAELADDPDFASYGGFEAVKNVDDDDTPAPGIYVGGEEVQVIDANALGRALAQAQGVTIDDAAPKVEELRKGLVGIDLGAAVAVIARFDEDGRHEVVPNADNELGTPAHVFWDEDGERLVGKEALRMAPSAPDRAFVDVKVLLSNPAFKTAVSGLSIDGEDLVAIVARRLLDDVEQKTGERPTHAALAAPAWFLDEHKEALRRAVKKAGVEVVGVAEEALAAAVPYSLKLEDLNPRRALVFDLGRSGLGVAVVRFAKGNIEVLKAQARRDLGATRWDDAIADEVAKNFLSEHGFDPREDKSALFDLRGRVDDAKKALSKRTTFTLVAAARGKMSKLTLARTAFEEATKGLVDQAREFVRSVRDQAGVKDWKDVDALIVTGGSSRMPMIRRMLQEETKIEPEKGINPDEGVAIGALYWGLLARSKAKA